MAMNTILEAARNDMIDALTARLNSGTINFYTSGETTLLATCTFNSTAFNAASGASATAQTISDDTNADNDGTAAVAVIKNSGGTTEFKGTCGEDSSYDFVFNSATIGAGDTVSVDPMTISMDAS